MGKTGKEICLASLLFSAIGAASAGWHGALLGALVGALVGWSSSREDSRKRAETRTALQASADEARADELRLVTNFLHASGIPAWRDAACELSALEHRQDVDPS